MCDKNQEQDPDYIPAVITVYVREPEPQPPALHDSRWYGPALTIGVIALAAVAVGSCGTVRSQDNAAIVNDTASVAVIKSIGVMAPVRQ